MEHVNGSPIPVEGSKTYRIVVEEIAANGDSGDAVVRGIIHISPLDNGQYRTAVFEPDKTVRDLTPAIIGDSHWYTHAINSPTGRWLDLAKSALVHAFIKRNREVQ